MTRAESIQRPFSRFGKTVRRFWPVAAVASFWLLIGGLNVSGVLDGRTFGIGFSTDSDFCDFRAMYMGGFAARKGLWTDLFPDDVSGLPQTVRIRYPEELDMRERGIRERVTPWLYPPPAAILFIPFSSFRYPLAAKIAVLTNGFFLLLLVHLARKEFSDLGCRTFVTDLLLVSVGCGYSAWLQFRSLNLGFPLAAAILLFLRGLRRGTAWTTAAGAVLLGVTKGFSAAWIPLLVLHKRWKTIGICVLLSFFLVAAAACLGCGLGPYASFLLVYAPATREFLPGFNDGIPRFLASLLFRNDPPAWFFAAVAFATVGALATVYLAAFAAMRRDGKNGQRVGTPLLPYVSALLVFTAFNTVCWKHYRIHLLALFPLLWNDVFVSARRKTFLALFAAAEFLPVRFVLNGLLDALPVPPLDGAGAVVYVVLIALCFRSPAFRQRPLDRNRLRGGRSDSGDVAVDGGSTLPAARQRLLGAIGIPAGGCAVFSRNGIPLLLLPTSDRRLAAATIGLYRPQTAKARIAASGLRLLNRLGGLRLLPRLPGTGTTAGILLCNPAHGARCIAIRRTGTGAFEILKAAEASRGEAVEAEHAALERVRGRPGVPDVGPLVRTSDAVCFTMPWLRPAPRRVDPAPLLRAWETDEREAAEDNGLIRELLPLLDDPTRAALAGKTVHQALVHGDFAPWNWRSNAAGHLTCIDWEWAREDGFAGFDLVYCLVQQALLVKKVPSERLLAFVQRRLSELDVGREFRSAGSELTPDILVSLVLAYRKTKGMDEQTVRGRAPERAETGIALPNAIC